MFVKCLYASLTDLLSMNQPFWLKSLVVVNVSGICFLYVSNCSDKSPCQCSEPSALILWVCRSLSIRSEANAAKESGS